MTLPILPNNVKPQTVAGLTGQIKTMLESSFASVWVAGEITSITNASSGHVYLNLKDRHAVLPAVMWRTTALRYRKLTKAGLQVVVRGKITVYGPQGKYQLTIDELYETGVGAQDRALRELKEKLDKLGYFARERKRRLPTFPRRIALVVSQAGAAIRDMLEIIARRWPRAEVWVVGVRVQGPGAALEIAAGVQRVNQFAGIDAILLGRGGGSSEDLSAFNEEVVARAIFLSRIPVVSAVGHEVDVTLADLVADRRAATPSEAAELVTPDRIEMMEMLRLRHDRMRGSLLAKFQANEQFLDRIAKRRVFRQPLERVRDEERKLDDWEQRLTRAVRQRVQRLRQKLESVAGKMESLSPLNVLARGYSLTRKPNKDVIRSVTQVAVGEAVEIILADGTLEADVKAKSDPETPT